jgi:alanine racemase
VVDPGGGGPPGHRPAWAEVDLAAVRHNCAVLRRVAAPSALCVVVKADGYGHGAEAVGSAALEGGATWLAVALVEEGVALRTAGIGCPLLLLSEPPPEAMGDVVAHHLTPTVYTRAGVRALAEAAAGAHAVVDAHVKVDTGMHRVGADPEEAAEVVGAVVGASHLRFAGLWTHLAVADGNAEEDLAFTELQLRRFAKVRGALEDAGLHAPIVHAANSAAAICHPAARLDMVRCGIAAYGLAPAAGLAPDVVEELRPALTLRARVSMVRTLDAGERPSYGRRYPLPETSLVATVPIGYADGVPRRAFDTGVAVLIGGRQRPLAGTVTMDQILVDCGPDPDVAAGDEVVLLGSQGTQTVGAWDWATRLGTVAYEVVCGIGARVPRVVVDSDAHSRPGADMPDEDRRATAAAGRLTDRGNDGEERG